MLFLRVGYHFTYFWGVGSRHVTVIWSFLYTRVGLTNFFGIQGYDIYLPRVTHVPHKQAFPPFLECLGYSPGIQGYRFDVRGVGLKLRIKGLGTGGYREEEHDACTLQGLDSAGLEAVTLQ